MVIHKLHSSHAPRLFRIPIIIQFCIGETDDTQSFAEMFWESRERKERKRHLPESTTAQTSKTASSPHNLILHPSYKVVHNSFATNDCTQSGI